MLDESHTLHFTIFILNRPLFAIMLREGIVAKHTFVSPKGNLEDNAKIELFSANIL